MSNHRLLTINFTLVSQVQLFAKTSSFVGIWEVVLNPTGKKPGLTRKLMGLHVIYCLVVSTCFNPSEKYARQ
jgi:hypothetical protein